MGSHLSSEIKKELECDDEQPTIAPLEFTSVDCIDVLVESKVQEQPIDDFFSRPESYVFTNPMDFERSQYSDDGTFPAETSTVIKEEADDPSDGYLF